ncbi:shikimate dehydrogenase [soil metagenome]
MLGVDWSYEAIEVDGATLPAFVAGRDDSWRGLSLTMPLKRDVLPLLTERDELVDLVGGANTVLFTEGGPQGFNTDVRGAVESFRDAGLTIIQSAQILGAGATAASVLVAVAQLGASRVTVSARTPEKAAPLVQLAAELGVDLIVRSWGVSDRSLVAPDAIVSTVPGGTNDMLFARPVREQSVLFDVSYDPWPSALAMAWSEVGGTVISGLDLLVNQAVGQIRLFLNGSDEPLPDEAAVVAAMRSAL